MQFLESCFDTWFVHFWAWEANGLHLVVFEDPYTAFLHRHAPLPHLDTSLSAQGPFR
jgi:hypothetical protein